MSRGLDAPDFDAAQALVRQLSFEIIDAQSTPQALGSWHISATAQGRPVRVIWDGQDGVLVIQHMKVMGCGDGWRDVWRAGGGYPNRPQDLETGLRALLSTG